MAPRPGKVIETEGFLPRAYRAVRSRPAMLAIGLGIVVVLAVILI